MMGFCLGVLLFAAAPATPDAGSPDGGVLEESKIIQVIPVVRAQEALNKAGDGLRADLPPSWREQSVLGLERWQWFGVPVLGTIIFFLTLLLVRLTALLIRRLRKDQTSANQIIQGISSPLRLWWFSMLARILVPLLGLTATSEEIWQHVFRLGVVIGFFWGVVRAVDSWSESFATSAFAAARPGSKALVSLFSRMTRFALMGFAILAVLNELGYSVTSVLAGLGIGGIALALGAQKTLENVFGAFALAIDQPIREGDFVRIDDFVGTVETIGLRSTRIRTLDRTLISIPNGKLADMRLETFAARDRVRLQTVVSLRFGSTAEQIKKVMEGFRESLRAQKELWPDSVAVNFVKIGASSLDIEVSAWFVMENFDEFRRVREDVLLRFLAVVESSGTSIAFPTQTIHLDLPLPAERGEGRGEGRALPELDVK